MTTEKTTSDPAVVVWSIVLAPRPRALAGRHWWRELVTSTYRDARDAWERRAEVETLGYRTELADFRRDNPPPTLRAFMAGLSSGRIDPYEVIE